MSAVGVKRRENESVGSLLRRFSRKIQRSKILISARAKQYRERSKSRYKKHKEALRRIKWQEGMERLRKLGKIE
jgi:ribosomal protein S21